MPQQGFDVIVIGSGFGGAITACRLAERGYRVLVLERGRRWAVKDFPRRATDAWVWDQNRPADLNGWFDFRVFPHMTVVAGAGVGGGSLVYANISVEAKPDTFNAGWPAEITYAELKPYYDMVGAMMGVRPVPTNQWPERTRVLRDAAGALGYGDRFRPLDLAVSFDPKWNYDLPDPHNPTMSKTFTNPQGKEQGTCVHLGNCDIGCDVNARNTLDLNYLAIAESKGADVRPLHVVRAIEPSAVGYQVSFDRIEGGALVPGSEQARLVIVAAGSIGSTELLLRSRDLTKTLPGLSPRLGRNWSSNGDFLTPAIHPNRAIRPTRGPTITTAIDLLDGAFRGQHVFIEDGGLPDLGSDYLQALASDGSADARLHTLIQFVRGLNLGAVLDHVMPWFAQGRDAANGVLSLNDGALDLAWDADQSAPTIDAIVDLHQQMAIATDGVPLTPLTWTLGRDLITPHPLGGCNMGAAAVTGVVNHAGEVFGYRNLYVADGSIVPEALGLNPSRTIGALAERVAAIIVSESR
jgi:cholesterol oxidase